MTAPPTRMSLSFNQAVTALTQMAWRGGMHVEEIGSPQRIAPYSLALAAELTDGDEELASGRLILLHDPAGNETWDGDFRIVSYARAEVDLAMVADPLLPEAAWSWMLDALAEHRAAYRALAGTVTASFSKSFGDMEGAEDKAEVELRSSWTPVLGESDPITGHWAAWQDLLGLIAGHPPLPASVIRLPGRS